MVFVEQRRKVSKLLLRVGMNAATGLLPAGRGKKMTDVSEKKGQEEDESRP
jgi:hypothetical protein